MYSCDEIVQGTQHDAASAKHTCASLGYIYDPWVRNFEHPRKQPSPLFNRGYWARVRGIQREIIAFVQQAKAIAPDVGVQIVNLGSGLDTMYWWLHHEQAEGRIPADTKMTYFEIDFPEVIQKKTQTIKRKDLIPNMNIVTNEKFGTTEIRMHDCRYVGVDLRMIKDVTACMEASGFDPSQHTCYVSECVLIYMQSLHGNEVVQWAADAVPSADVLKNFIVYEQTNATTAFGKMMIKNLNARGCPLLSIHDFPTLESQEKRYLERGWRFVHYMDMNEVYSSLPDDDRARIEKIELLDEVEELKLMQAHYFILIASSHEKMCSRELAP